MAEVVAKIFYITKTQDRFLKRIKRVSNKSESALVREALELLFKSPRERK